ncbi:MAG: superoxide dismutase [Hyphomicrobiales bacterium]|nr:MAG: superoxide dismutase [Hyphomicrobiales bacterium]
MAFELTVLPYAADALQPYMSAETLEFHHGKHHATYVTNANKLIEGSGLEGKSLEDVIIGSRGSNVGLFNNAAQTFNHDFYWRGMKPNGGGSLPGAIASKIDSDLGGLAKFKEDFLNAGVTQFGSGWAWLVLRDGKLAIEKTANAENPLGTGATPLLVCDVWEHAYYIDYRNARPKFLEAWFDNLVNWDFVLEQFEAAK